MAFDPEFIPSSLDMRFRQWARNGVMAFCTIANGNDLQSFDQLSNVYNNNNNNNFFNKEIEHWNIDWPSEQLNICPLASWHQKY